jgi:hypothetical protein
MRLVECRPDYARVAFTHGDLTTRGIDVNRLVTGDNIMQEKANAAVQDAVSFAAKNGFRRNETHFMKATANLRTPVTVSHDEDILMVEIFLFAPGAAFDAANSDDPESELQGLLNDILGKISDNGLSAPPSTLPPPVQATPPSWAPPWARPPQLQPCGCGRCGYMMEPIKGDLVCLKLQTLDAVAGVAKRLLLECADSVGASNLFKFEGEFHLIVQGRPKRTKNDYVAVMCEYGNVFDVELLSLYYLGERGEVFVRKNALEVMAALA